MPIPAAQVRAPRQLLAITKGANGAPNAPLSALALDGLAGAGASAAADYEARRPNRARL